jgi:lipopolysaccharide export system protein LptC
MAGGPGLYSRMVAVLKVGLPLVAVGLLASLFLVQTDDRLGGNVVFSPGDVEALGSGLSITGPTFTGTTSGGDRFRFTADLVEPDAAPPERAHITALDGTLDLRDGPEVTLSARTGDLDIPTQRLDIAGDVVITSSDGYRMVTDKATIDLRAGAFVAGDRVVSTGPLGEITAGSLHVAPANSDGEARRFSFSDGVRLVYDPPDSG